MTLVLNPVTTYSEPNPRQISGPDDFSEGNCGWTPLLSGFTPCGAILPAKFPGLAGTSMALCTEDGTGPYSYASAWKRLTLPLGGVHKIGYSMNVAMAAYRGPGIFEGPAAVDFALDTGFSPQADGSNNRCTYLIRFLNKDPIAAGPNQRFQLGSGTTQSSVTWVDFPGMNTITQGAIAGDVATLATTTPHGYSVGQTVGISGLSALTELNGYWIITAVTSTTFSFSVLNANVSLTTDSAACTTAVYPIGYNENKRGMFSVTCVFDIVNHCQSGFAVSGSGGTGIGWGDLASTPNGSLSATPAAIGALNESGLASFYGGMNLGVEVYGVTIDYSYGKSQVFVNQPEAWIFA